MSGKLSFRAERALEAFEGRGSLRYCDLPNWVGRKTMADLVALGLVEVATPELGPDAKNYAWRLR